MTRILLWAWIIFIGIPMMMIMGGLAYGSVMEFLKWIK